MARDPELEDFRRRSDALVRHRILKGVVRDDEVHLARLSLEDIGELMGDEEGYYFLIAAAGLNRTSLKTAARTPDDIQKRLYEIAEASLEMKPCTASCISEDST